MYVSTVHNLVVMMACVHALQTLTSVLALLIYVERVEHVTTQMATTAVSARKDIRKKSKYVQVSRLSLLRCMREQLLFIVVARSVDPLLLLILVFAVMLLISIVLINGVFYVKRIGCYKSRNNEYTRTRTYDIFI